MGYYMVERGLQQFAENHSDLISARLSLAQPNLQLLNIKKKVYDENLWCPEIFEMHGLVVDANWRPVVRPYRKYLKYKDIMSNGKLNPFRNWHPTLPVAQVEKIGGNSFMATLTHDREYGFVVTTLNSLDSKWTRVAENHLLPLIDCGIIDGVTYIFQIIIDEPISDKPVIWYDPGVYLIGCRAVCSKINLLECDLDVVAEGFPDVLRPMWKENTLADAIEEVKKSPLEGFIIYEKERTNPYNHGFIMQSDHYLNLIADK